MSNFLKKFLGKINGAKAPAGNRSGELKLRFREFKYLLRANNEVLAIIADIQTHLKNGELVGLDFLRSRYIDASAKVFKMIRHLDAISGGSYAGLVDSFHRVRSRIDGMLEEAGGRGKGYPVITLEQLPPGSAHLAGNKADRLAELSAAGLPVPPGFVVTTAAFHRFMDYAGLAGQLRQAVMLMEGTGPREVEGFSRLLQRRIMESPLPPGLEEDLNLHAGMLSRQGANGRLSFRSSAVGEDSSRSFAGLYMSLLEVPSENAATAYRQVLAALYAPEAVAYRRRQGLLDQDAEMAVLVQPMLDPVSSGVVYTTDPLAGGRGPLLVSAVPGLGSSLVDGSRDPDLFMVTREHPPSLLECRPAAGGRPCSNLPEEQALELARLGLELEERFGCPQDIEWALTKAGVLLLLQSRPLRVLSARSGQAKVEQKPLLTGGSTARPGAGSGKAHVVADEHDLADFPDGAVLVARTSSPAFGAVLQRAAAVVTDIGGVAGHMASLAREMGVPALVGAGRATELIANGREITVDAGAGRIYPGRVESLLSPDPQAKPFQCKPRPKPPWHAAGEFITKLNLTDPESPDFRADNCQSFHDILRFAHEMSFREMFRLGDLAGQEHQGEARRLEVKLPFELWLIDLGGGISPEAGEVPALDQILSVPCAALLRGLTDPAVDWRRPRPVNAKGLASVFSASLLNPPGQALREMGKRAYAVVGREYLNFNCRVGYHYTALDSFLGSNLNDNYISFRFHGGAATEDRRRLRCRLIHRLLEGMGFKAETKGDQVSGFLKKYPAGDTARILEELGRLVLFTRQMDMLMSGAEMVDWLAKAFARKNYNLVVLQKDGPDEASL